MMFVPKVEQKVWGEALHIFANDHAAVSLLKVNRGFRCSRHYHCDRFNMFAVQEGVICVESWHDLKAVRSLKMMIPGETHTVAPRIWHRFNVIQTGRMVEVYWPIDPGMVRADDIVRERDEHGAVIPGGPYDVDRLLYECSRSDTWGP